MKWDRESWRKLWKNSNNSNCLCIAFVPHSQVPSKLSKRKESRFSEWWHLAEQYGKWCMHSSKRISNQLRHFSKHLNQHHLHQGTSYWHYCRILKIDSCVCISIVYVYFDKAKWLCLWFYASLNVLLICCLLYKMFWFSVYELNKISY